MLLLNIEQLFVFAKDQKFSNIQRYLIILFKLVKFTQNICSQELCGKGLSSMFFYAVLITAYDFDNKENMEHFFGNDMICYKDTHAFVMFLTPVLFIFTKENIIYNH